LNANIILEKATSIMAVTVRIPTPLRTLTGGSESVSVEAKNVRELVETLEGQHPGMKERLMDDKGVRRFVNLYVGEEDIRFLDGLETELKDGDEVSIVPAIAGGSGR
jgi:sulfur-carrier protein